MPAAQKPSPHDTTNLQTSHKRVSRYPLTRFDKQPMKPVRQSSPRAASARQPSTKAVIQEMPFTSA